MTAQGWDLVSHAQIPQGQAQATLLGWLQPSHAHLLCLIGHYGNELAMPFRYLAVGPDTAS